MRHVNMLKDQITITLRTKRTSFWQHVCGCNWWAILLTITICLHVATTITITTCLWGAKYFFTKLLCKVISGNTLSSALVSILVLEFDQEVGHQCFPIPIWRLTVQSGEEVELGNISMLTSNHSFPNFNLSSAWLISIWKCIQFWWKENSSDHIMRWIPRIHLVLQDLIQVSESIISEKWKFINRFYLILVRTNERHCAAVCYAQCIVSDIIEKWTFISRLYLILVRTNERHCSCAVVCYAQWAECLLLHEWYQDNRPTVWMGKMHLHLLKRVCSI